MPRLDRLWYVIDAETKGFDEGVMKSGEKLQSFTDYAKGNPMVVLGAIGAAAAVAGFKMMQMAATFEKSMRMVQTVTDTSTITMAALSDGVLATFSSLPIQSLEEMTQGLYDIISSGVPAADAITYLNVAAQAAVGGVTSVAIAVDGLTTATNAWAAQGLTVEQASDQMFQAVNKGKMSFGELAGSMGTVASMAAGLNVPLSDVLAVSAQLTLNGMSTAESMTAVRSALSNIIKPTGTLQQQFPELARHFNRARLEGDGLVKFLTDFDAASHSNGAALTALFGDVQALSGAMGVLKDGGVAVTQMLADVQDSAGAASTAAKIMSDSVVDTEQTLKNKLHAELTRGGGVVLPLWMGALKAATGLLKLYNDEANNTRFLDFGKGVGDRGAGFAAGGTGMLGTIGMERDLSHLWALVGDGAVDTQKMTVQQLRGIADAYAKTQADLLGVTVDDWKRTQAVIMASPTHTSGTGTVGTQGFEYFTTLAAKREQTEAAAAATAQQRSATNVANLAQEGRYLARVVDATAETAKHYKGMGDEAQRAQLAQAGALGAIAEAETKVAAARTALEAATTKGDADGQRAAIAQMKAALTAINDQHAVLTTAGEQLTAAGKRAATARAQLLAAADEYARGGEKSPVDEAETKIRTLTLQATTAHVALADIAAAVAKIRAGAQGMADRLSRDLAASVEDAALTVSGDAMAIAASAAARQLATIREQIDLSHTLSTAEKDRLRGLVDSMAVLLRYKTQLVGLTQAVTDYDDAQARHVVATGWQQLRDDASGGPRHDPIGPSAREQQALLEAEQATRQQMAELEAQRLTKTDAYRALSKTLLDLEQRRLKVEQDAQALAVSRIRAQSAAVRDQAQAITGVVGMATQLAQAFGAIGPAMASALTAITAIGAGIGPLLDEIQNLKTVDSAGNPMATIGSVVGMAAPIAGAVASLLGSVFNSAEDPAVVQARSENTQALRDLSQHIGDLSKATVTGQDLSGAQAGIAALIQAISSTVPAWLGDSKKLGDDHAEADRILRAAGSSWQQVEDVAKALGMSLVTLADLKKVLEATKAADLAAYTDSFAGSMEQLSDSLRAYDVTDPTERLRRTIAVLTNAKTGIPAIMGALQGVDATSGAGSLEAIAHLQALLAQLAAGTLDASALGGASIDETRQAILDLIDQIRGSSGASGTGGYNTVQTITETTGSHLAGLLVNVSSFTERTAIATELMARSLRSGTVEPLLPPSVASVTGVRGASDAAAGVTFSPGAIVVTVQLTAAAGATAPAALAEQIGAAAAQATSEALAHLLRTRAMANGSVRL